MTSPGGQVRAYGDGEADAFDGEAAEHKDRAGHGRCEQNDGRNAEEESRWHDQQAGVFHGSTLSKMLSVHDRCGDWRTKERCNLQRSETGGETFLGILKHGELRLEAAG